MVNLGLKMPHFLSLMLNVDNFLDKHNEIEEMLFHSDGRGQGNDQFKRTDTTIVQLLSEYRLQCTI